jgi:hypothetical protein
MPPSDSTRPRSQRAGRWCVSATTVRQVARNELAVSDLGRVACRIAWPFLPSSAMFCLPE